MTADVDTFTAQHISTSLDVKNGLLRVTGFCRPARIKRLEAVLEEHAQREWLKMVEAGGDDICADFGAIFSAWVEVSWLNLSDETAPLLARTAAAWVNAWREERKEEVGFYSTKLYDIARDLFADRKREMRVGDEDPASSLLLERDAEGRELDNEQLMSVEPD